MGEFCVHSWGNMYEEEKDACTCIFAGWSTILSWVCLVGWFHEEVDGFQMLPYENPRAGGLWPTRMKAKMGCNKSGLNCYQPQSVMAKGWKRREERKEGAKDERKPKREVSACWSGKPLNEWMKRTQRSIRMCNPNHQPFVSLSHSEIDSQFKSPLDDKSVVIWLKTFGGKGVHLLVLYTSLYIRSALQSTEANGHSTHEYEPTSDSSNDDGVREYGTHITEATVIIDLELEVNVKKNVRYWVDVV